MIRHPHALAPALVLATGLFLAMAPCRVLATTPYIQGEPTDHEQLLLELTNRARANPSAEATRYGLSDINQGLVPGTISTAAKPPLVFHPQLLDAARLHSQWMLDNDIFSHTGAGGSSSKDRMQAAGYPFTGFWGEGENLSLRTTTGTLDLTAMIEAHHRQLFLSTEHRPNLMQSSYDEAGYGVKTGAWTDSSTTYPSSSMATQNFAYSGGSPSPDGPFVTGVVYADGDANGMYSPGEGISGVTVTPASGNFHAVTTSSGGYAFPISYAAGSLVLTFTGGPFAGQTQTVTLPGGVNVKVDKVAAATRVIGLSGDLAFGSIAVGQTAQRTLTISNSGTAALAVSGITYPAGFSGAWSGTIPAGGSQDVTVTFAPSAVQAYSGTVTVNSDKTSGSNTLSASGTGAAATRIIGLSGDLAFGSVTAGQTAQRTLTISNTGTGALAVSGITYPTGFSGAWSGTIPAGGSQIVTVTFAPAAVQAYSGTVTVNSDKTSGTHTIGASGSGTTAPTRVIALSPSSMSFGNVVAGQTATRILAISNTGTGPLAVSGIAFPAGFSGNWSGTILPGATQNVTISFAPTAAQAYSGTVTVNSDKSSGTNTLSVSGTGTAAPTRILSLSPNPIAFGNVATGQSATRTLTLYNSGNGTLTVAGIAYPSGFSGAWSGTIPPGGNKKVTVTFSPAAAVAYSGTVTVTSDKTWGPNTISISGTGTGSATGYTGWIAGYFTPGSPEADPLAVNNPSGYPNLFAYGFGLHPGTGTALSGTFTPHRIAAPADPAPAKFLLWIPVSPPSDAVFVVEQSTGLTGWTEISRRQVSGSWIGPATVQSGSPANGYVPVEISLTTPPGQPAAFARVLVTAP